MLEGLVNGVLAVVPSAGALSLLGTALLLGVRHGIDWDHIAAITDITSTTVGADADRRSHLASRTGRPDLPAQAPGQLRFEQRRALLLGTLYALGHACVVAALGLLALTSGALLPDWVDPIMSRVVGVTLIILGLWVFYSVYSHLRHGTAFRLRSRWLLLFASLQYGWRRLRAMLHRHGPVEPVVASSYGARTALGIGMIHGIGAETGTQVLIIAAVGGASSLGLGIPMMIAFILGLLISNSAIVLFTATGFVASQLRDRVYLIVGSIAGVLSLVVGLLFLFQAEGMLPELSRLLGSGGG
jgi:high-affinity nickel-transport protein